MGIALVAGRAFAAEDLAREQAEGAARTVILNQTAARRLSPGASLLGRTVSVNGRPRTVVGVVEDTRDRRLDAPVEPQWYAPAYFGTSQLVVRTRATRHARRPRCARRCWPPTRASWSGGSSRSAPSSRPPWPSGASRPGCSPRSPRSRWCWPPWASTA
jgi:hypothetical protein